MPNSLFEAAGVNKRFGSVEALSNLSVALGPGSIGLVGPNGSGKTTLIRLLLGLLEPDTGTLTVLGHDSQQAPLDVRAQVGYMPEHDCLSPDMTGIGFVAHMGRVSGLPKEAAISRAHDVLEFVGLAEQRYRKIREYSVGMRQRVKLAQAIVHDPPLCFLDEPTAGLDPRGREEMLALLRALSQLPNHSFVLSTHLLPDADGLCDQVLMLNAGRLLAAGPVRDLLSSHEGESVVRIKGDAEPFLAGLVQRGLAPKTVDGEIHLVLAPGASRAVFEAAAEAGAQVRYLGRSVATIEGLFMARVEHPTGEVSA
ncbi:MAG TPA: ABC transporter ATP-binding protein [Thermoplasmata archaeon]|nr:ABC transporter ATP-binding protein [Thermoplasmata archaeon]